MTTLSSSTNNTAAGAASSILRPGNLGGSIAVQPIVSQATSNTNTHSQHLQAYSNIPIATVCSSATPVSSYANPHHVVHFSERTPRVPLFCGLSRQKLKVVSVCSSLAALIIYSAARRQLWSSLVSLLFIILGIFGCTGLCAVIPVDEYGHSKNDVFCCGCGFFEHQAMSAVGSLLALLFLILGTAISKFASAAVWFLFFMVISIVGCIGQCNTVKPRSEQQQNSGAAQDIELAQENFRDSQPIAILPVPAVRPAIVQPRTAGMQWDTVPEQSVGNQNSRN